MDLADLKQTVFSAEIEVNSIATVNFIGYRKQSFATLKGVIAYVSQQKKTGISKKSFELKHEVREYENCEIRLLSGLNCTPETAFAEFISTKASYNKVGGTQFYHYTQSFKDGENISPKTAHEIAMKFAKTHYKDFEVLIATHIDNEHLHSHFIINSVSFETGKKLHQPPNTLRKLRLISDNICKEYGLSTLKTYTYGRSKTMGRAETRAKERGTSWKFQLCLTIETAMKKAKSKEEFLRLMENKGCQVKWDDDKNHIIYTHPNGNYCGDDRLYGKKYQKENMLKELKIRESSDFNSGTKTGWEYERKDYLNMVEPQHNQSTKLTLKIGQDIMDTFKRYEDAENYDDELTEIANIAKLTALSFVGVYALIEMIRNHNSDEFYLDDLDKMIEEIKQEPENTQEFEEEQEQGFTMTMGGY